MRLKAWRQAVRVLPLVLVLLILGCEGGGLTDPSVPPSGETGSQSSAAPATAGEAAVLELRFDETVSAAALRLRWLELNDSRCPLGVQCVWEGQAVVTVEISGDDLAAERVDLTLRAGVEPAVVVVAAHELQLLDVEPYPREGVTPERGEYVATLEIRPV